MSTKSCNVVLGAHGEIFGLSRMKKSPIPAGGKEAPPRLLAGTNVKAGTNTLSAQPVFEASSQD